MAFEMPCIGAIRDARCKTYWSAAKRLTHRMLRNVVLTYCEALIGRCYPEIASLEFNVQPRAFQVLEEEGPSRRWNTVRRERADRGPKEFRKCRRRQHMRLRVELGVMRRRGGVRRCIRIDVRAKPACSPGSGRVSVQFVSSIERR